MPEPITVTISHALGRDEAKRRLDNGLGYIRQQLAAFVSSVDYGWTGYQLDFGMVAMRQSITGRIEVEDRLVRVELGLPLLLRLLSRQIIGRIVMPRTNTGSVVSRVIEYIVLNVNGRRVTRRDCTYGNSTYSKVAEIRQADRNIYTCTGDKDGSWKKVPSSGSGSGSGG